MHVAFDLGNVLLNVDLKIFERALDAQLHKAVAKKQIDHPKLLIDSETFLLRLQKPQDLGMMDLAEGLAIYYPFLEDTAIDALVKSWNQVVTPNEVMMNFVANLKDEGVKIAFLSNIGFTHLELLRKTLPELLRGSVEHMSCEVGARKPSRLYYQSFLMDHADFIGGVYVDDLEANLKVGKQFRFKTFQFDLHAMMKESLSIRKKELDKIKSYIMNLKYVAK